MRRTTFFGGRSVEPLEPRRLLAAAVPTDAEVYLVELLNRARSDPLGEALRFGIDLNEGIDPGTISVLPKQPLAINPFLVDGARGHSQWMVDNDVFAHEGEGGSSPTERMMAAGYTLTPPWATGENIALRGQTPTVPELVPTTAQLHQDLFVDEDYPERGHRVNLLSDDFKEVGTGIATGDFQGYNSVVATEDFAFTGSASFLTGVAYTDAVSDDDFYTPGEGLGGVTVSARRASDGQTFTTTTWDSGGYSLRLPSGTYEVTGAGPGLNGTVRFSNVVIGAKNVKRDFLPLPPAATSVSARWLFYNSSSYDGNNAAATAADLLALATDKLALRPGGAASFANVSSYVKGINGVLVDFAGVPNATLGADDFVFRSGPGLDPTNWGLAPAPASVVSLPTPTGSNTARYAITWPDNAIRNAWLQVTVRANEDTGLAEDDVFYFGNLAGEAGDAAATFRVTALDMALVRQTLGGPSSIEGRTDFNRDGRVNALDLAVVRGNLSRRIESITPPATAAATAAPASATALLQEGPDAWAASA